MPIDSTMRTSTSIKPGENFFLRIVVVGTFIYASSTRSSSVCSTTTRVCDTLSLDCMDHFALLIKLRGDAGVGSLGSRMMGSSGWAGGGLGGLNSNSPHAQAMGELNRLAHDLIGTNQRRPEPWLAVSGKVQV